MMWEMSKASSGRRARAEIAHCIAVAQRSLKVGKYADAIGPLSQAARLAPRDPVVLNDLGTAYLDAGRPADGVPWLQRSIALEPRVGYVHYNLAMALEQTGDDDSAILAYRRAVTLDPDRAMAHAMMADVLLRKGKRADATAAYWRASVAEPATVLAQLCRAVALDLENRTSEAEDELRQVIGLHPSNSMAHFLLGRLLAEAGRFDEAASSFERTIEIAPGEHRAYLGLANSRKFTEADRHWIAKVLSRVERKDGGRSSSVVSDRQQMEIHFALGKILDDLSEYADAMKHFTTANRIRRSLCPCDMKAVERDVFSMIARFTREFMSGYVQLGDEAPTPVLIVGMPRSGTTLLERIISSHPKVRGCGELDFWTERGPACAGADAEKLAEVAEQLRRDYLRELRGTSDSLRATDKVPFNFFWVGLIHLLFPNARFIHCRRSPIDTCLSIYRTSFTTDSWGFASDLGDLAWYYRLYLRIMDHWRMVIPSDRLLDVDYEDVVDDIETAARRLIAFCDLEWDAACLRPEQNRDSVRTASKWQARQPVYRSAVERWRRYEPWIGDLRELLPPSSGLDS
jgi:tetratricopeptide (TPR) repeat protein